MMTRLLARARWRSSWPGCVLALCSLLTVACSTGPSGGLCPQYEVASGVTVDASEFFAAHPGAYELCVTGTRCMLRQAGEDQMSTIVATGTATALDIEVSVATKDGAPLVSNSARVTLHRVSGACGHGYLHGSVTVTAHGALIAS